MAKANSSKRTPLEKVAILAKRTGGEVYPNYSGRGMRDAQCVGVAVKDRTAAIMEAGKLRLPVPSTDSMGLDYILYWPGIKA